MEFGKFKIDLIALTGLIAAIGGLWMQIKGAKKRRQNKEDDNVEK